MEEKKSIELSAEELSSFTSSYAHFNKITQKLQKAYKALEEKFENLNRKLEETNNQLRQSLAEKDRISNYLNNILESLNSGVLAIDPEGRITLFNRAAEEILGYKTQQVLGKPYMKIMGKEVKRELTPLHILKTGISHLNEEKEVKTRKGKKIPLGFSTSLLTDGEGNHLGAVEVFFDLTHLKNLEQEVTRIKTLAALGEMAATVAHEVRNPLGGIAGFAALLERDLEPDDPRRRLVNKITQGVEILNRLVINLLNYTKVIKLNPQELDFIKFLNETVNFFQIDLSSRVKNISIRKHFPKEGIECWIDSEQFRQVILNVLRNSVQAMPQGGKIDIHSDLITREDEDKVVLKISDTGEGMSPETQEKLFTPFFTTKDGGTGLGLPTVKKIIEAHKGDVEVKSNLGQGTTISLSFPRRADGIRSF
jgi:PAS domain S-box-containing protein